jgi:hypothetical protein
MPWGTRIDPFAPNSAVEGKKSAFFAQNLSFLTVGIVFGLF